MGIALAATFAVAQASAQSDDTRISAGPVDLHNQIDAAPNGPERIRLQLKLADQLVAADKKPEAIAELHLVSGTDVFDPQDLYNAGNALARLGDSEEAINAYRKAIDQRKGNYSQTDLAVREWRRVIAIDPGHTAAIQALGRAGGEGRIALAPAAGCQSIESPKGEHERVGRPGD